MVAINYIKSIRFVVAQFCLQKERWVEILDNCNKETVAVGILRSGREMKQTMVKGNEQSIYTIHMLAKKEPTLASRLTQSFPLLWSWDHETMFHARDGGFLTKLRLVRYFLANVSLYKGQGATWVDAFLGGAEAYKGSLNT